MLYAAGTVKIQHVQYSADSNVKISCKMLTHAIIKRLFCGSVLDKIRFSSADHGLTKLAAVCQTRQHSTFEEEMEELRVQQVPDQDIPVPIDSTRHEVMNFFIQGYDCTSVEHFAQFTHNLAKNMDLTIFDSFAMPTKHTLVHTIQAPGLAEKLKLKDFTMMTHQRVLQLQQLEGTIAPIFLEMLQINLPEGVGLKVEPHSQYHHKERYIQKEIPQDLL